MTVVSSRGTAILRRRRIPTSGTRLLLLLVAGAMGVIASAASASATQLTETGAFLYYTNFDASDLAGGLIGDYIA